MAKGNRESRIARLENRALGDVLAELEGFVKIGTDNGTAFVYAGEVADYDPDAVDKACMSRKQRAYDNAEARVKYGITHPGTDVADYMKFIKKRGGDNLEAVKPDFEDYIEFVKRQMEVLCKAADNLKKCRERLEKYTPLLDREVVEAYPATTQFDPPNTTILIVKGYERGELWSVDEADGPDVIPFDSPRYEEEFGDES